MHGLFFFSWATLSSLGTAWVSGWFDRSRGGVWHCGCHQRAGRQEGGSEREQAIGDVCHVGWKEGSWGRTDRYGEIRQCGVPDGVKEQVMVMLREWVSNWKAPVREWDSVSYLSWSLQHLPLCPALSRCSVNQINIPKMDLWGQGSGCGRESGWPDARVLTDSG